MNVTRDEEMKEHAETVMNELLGWYGYEKLSEVDSRALNLCLFPQSTASTTESVGILEHGDVNFRRTAKSSFSSTQSPSFRSFPANNRTECIENLDLKQTCRSTDENKGTVSFFPISEDDTSVEQHLYCSWCKKNKKSRNFSFRTKNRDQVFCSEVCFAHYSRSNTKQNKICDWCRHVRHTITYVDFDDGDGQYQFCSDKCLNQFKLDIFCQETKEHLEIHPHHCDQLNDTTKTSLSSLITPDLWLRNCSPNKSASEKRSRSTRKSSFPSAKQLSSVTSQKTKSAESSKPIEILPAVENSSKDEEIRAKITNEVLTSSTQLHNNELRNDKNRESSFATKISSAVPNSLTSPSSATKTGKEIPATWFLNMAQTPNNHERYKSTSPKKPSSHNSRIPPLLPLINYKRNSPTETSTSSSSVVAAAQAASILTKSSFPTPTILVPYPVILPLPIPFPIPIPLPIVINETKNKNVNNEPQCEETRSNSTSPNPTDSNDSINSAWSSSPPPSADIRPIFDHTYENKIKKLKKN